MDLKTQKTRARHQARQVRNSVSKPEAAEAAVELIRHFPPKLFKNKLVAGFASLRSEIDLFPLLHALSDRGVTLALPCTPRKGRPLLFRAWHPKDDLVAGPFGTREPSAQQSELRPDILLVPLLAFTDQGDRLGYGGGFYDRTLQKLRNTQTGPCVFACGVAYDIQRTDWLPSDRFDQTLDAVLTEVAYQDFNKPATVSAKDLS